MIGTSVACNGIEGGYLDDMSNFWVRMLGVRGDLLIMLHMINVCTDEAAYKCFRW